jgi:hypothetical protein
VTLLSLLVATQIARADAPAVAEPVAEPVVEQAAPPSQPAVQPPTDLAVAQPPTSPSASLDPSAVDLYRSALEAWREKNVTAALTLSTASVNTDPLLAEAWLLRSYAHLRLDDRTRALASVRLARESSRADVRAAARALEAQLTEVYVRDSPSLYFGLGPQVELRYGQGVPHVGLNLGVGVPVLKRISARVEVRWTALDPRDLGVAGARASAMAAWTLPLGNGRWSLTPSVGPSLWLATGQYWSDGSNPYLGARADVDLDGRLSPTVGIYLAAGTEVYPGQMAELSWLAEPLDFRTGMRFWFWGG